MAINKSIEREVRGDEPFMVPAENFNISESSSGYCIMVATREEGPYHSIDTEIPAGDSANIYGAVPGSWFRLLGNQTIVRIYS